MRTKHLNVRISNRSKIHTIPDSFCVGMKTIPDRDSVHTEKNGDFGAISMNVAKLRRVDL